MSVKNLFLLDKEFARKHSRPTSSDDFDKKYPYRLACNRRNKRSSKPYWDIEWRSAISSAITEFKVKHVYVNGGVFFTTHEAKSNVENRATEIWHEKQKKNFINVTT